MLSGSSVMRDFYDGSYDAKRKTNIVDKKAKEKRPTNSHNQVPDTKLHVKTRDFGSSLTRATINLKYDTTPILKKALKQVSFFSEHANFTLPSCCGT